MTDLRVWGVVFLVGAAALAVGAVVVPGVLVPFALCAIVFVACGALFLWMHSFVKDVPKVGMRSGLARAAAGTAFAARTLEDMTGRGAPAHHGVDPRPGTATIQAVTDTGMLVNFDPVVLIDLAVTVDGRPEYAVRTREIVSKLQTARLARGTTVPVMVDAQDPFEVMIDWG